MADEPVRVLVADDHPIFRDGLAVLLGSVDGIEVVGTAATGAEAVTLAVDLLPDVVVMDVQMPGLNGIEATRRLATEASSVGVVVLTMSEDDGTVFSAVRAGARGYLVKGAEQDEIVRAIRTVASGGAVFGATLARRIAEFFAAGPRRRRPRSRSSPPASGRSSNCSPPAAPTPRSHRPCSCPRRRSATTSPTSSRSCRSPTAPRPSSGPARPASAADTPGVTRGRRRRR